MELDKLKPSDICKIIKECAQSHVTELKLGTFTVSFSHKANLEEETPLHKPEVGSFPELDPEKTEEVVSIAQIQDRSERLNEEVQELIVSDPEEYERLMALEELEDAEEKDIGSDPNANGLGVSG